MMSLQNLQVEFADMILSDHELSIPLRIYRNNITSILFKQLQLAYPLLIKLLGDDCFTGMALSYIKQYPSLSSDVHEYGEYFATFLSEQTSLNDFVYLTEVAQFEWICHCLQFAEEHEIINLQPLASISETQYENLYFNLNPACCIKQFQYPILRIVELCRDEETIDEVLLDEGGIHLLISRNGLDISLMPLSAAEYIFLSALHQGKSLTDALNTALKADTNFKLEISLPLWIKNKTIVGCYVE